MRQHAADWRRLGLAPGGYETMEHRSAGMHIDAGMMERHEYLTRQRGAGSDGHDDDLARRRRELELLELQA